MYVFAAFSAGFALMVSLNTDDARLFVQKFADDSRTVFENLQPVYEFVRKFDLNRIIQENQDFAEALVAFPTAPLAALNTQLEEAQRRIQAN
ncbi:hypothetical protein [Roseibium sp.]|uniref:hypothetical protein n=1 Tax=Roseibium sp. TaxID=1936156 RepID=UPI003A96FBE7